MIYSQFHAILQQWNIPTNYLITPELLNSEVEMQQIHDQSGNLELVIIRVRALEPAGVWILRFGPGGPHGISWDGQLIPAYDEAGLSNTIHAALNEAVEDLRIVQIMETATNSIGPENIDRLKQFQTNLSEFVIAKETELAALAEVVDPNQLDLFEEGESDGESTDGSETLEGETTDDGSETSSENESTGETSTDSTEETSTTDGGDAADGAETTTTDDAGDSTDTSSEETTGGGETTGDTTSTTESTDSSEASETDGTDSTATPDDSADDSTSTT